MSVRSLIQSAFKRALQRTLGATADFLRPGFLSRVGGAYGSEVTDPYSQHDWTYAALEMLAKTVASVQLIAVTGSTKKFTRLEGDWQKLFDNPCPGLDRADFWRATVIYLYAFRGCKWYLIGELGPRKQGEIPKEIWPVPGEWAVPLDESGAVLRDFSKRPAKWKITAGDKMRYAEPWQIADTKFFNPRDPMTGFSPLDPARAAINFGYAAQAYAASTFVNGCDPGGWLKIPAGYGATKEQRNQIRDAWEEDHRGVDKNGKVGILVNGAEYIPNSVTLKDMQYLGGQEFARDSLVATLGVMKAMLGVTDNLNYATFIGMRRIFHENTAIPLMTKLADLMHRSVMGGGEAWAKWDTDNSEAFSAGFMDKLLQAKDLKELGYDADQINTKLELGMPPAPPDPFLAQALKETLAEPKASTGETQAQPGPAQASPAGEGFNGAQVTSLVDVIKQVSLKEIPGEAAKVMIVKAYPTITPAEAATMVDAATVFVPASVEAAQAEAEAAKENPIVDAPGAKGKLIVVHRGSRAWLRAEAEAQEFVAFRLEKYILPYERKLGAQARKYFSTLAAHQTKLFEEWIKRNKLKPNDIATLSADDLKAIIFQGKEWDTQLQDLARSTIQQAVKTQLKATAQENDGISISISSPKVTQFIGATMASLIKTNRSARGSIRANLQAGMAAGETIRELQERLINSVPFKPAWALRVARTEVAFAASGSRFLQYSEDGIEKIRWMTAGDSEVRDSHAKVNNEVVVLGEKFSNGLKHPHEIGADGSEVINCRCDLLSAVEV